MKTNTNNHENIIEDIILALGERNKFSYASKLKFAEAVIRYLAFGVDEEETILFERGNEILGAVNNLEGALLNVQKNVFNKIDGSNAYQLAKKHTGYELNAEKVFALLRQFRKELAPRIAAKGYGKNNIRELAIAKMVADFYHQHFKKYPSTGKGERVGNRKSSKLKETPYDRVCVILGKYSPSKYITFPTRVQAIKLVKQGGGMRPHKIM